MSDYRIPALYAFFAFITFTGECNCNADKKPHIVMIIGDDMGWNDVGFHGNNALKTPNIDALAYNGIILNNHYSLPLCTPSRAALLTGNYPIRTGFQGWPITAGENRKLPHDVPLMPELLKPLGYATHLVGKWHLGHAYKNCTPTARGFDTFFGYWNGFIGYENYVVGNSQFNGVDMHDGYEPVESTIGDYATDAFTERAERIVSEHDRDEPLFLVVSHLAAHTGWDGHELGLKNKTANEAEFRHIGDGRRRDYAGVMKSFDESIGRIMTALSRRNMLKDAIVLVFSDNGGPTADIYANTASNWPLRGIKGSLAQGGVRTFAAIWSDSFAFKRIVSNELVHITDWLPTFYAAAGGDVKSLGDIDGVNQWDALINNKRTNRDELLVNIDEVRHEAGLIGYGGMFKLLEVTRNDTDIFYGFYGDGTENMSKQPYDYESVLGSDVHREFNLLQSSHVNYRPLTRDTVTQIRNRATLMDCRCGTKTDDDLSVALFDLIKDPCETTNVAADYPTVVNRLRRRLNRFRKELVPQKNSPFDPCSNPKYYRGYWSTWLNEPHVDCIRSE